MKSLKLNNPSMSIHCVAMPIVVWLRTLQYDTNHPIFKITEQIYHSLPQRS